MGALGGMAGLAGGNSGTGYSTPSGTNSGQLNTAYDQNQNLINALQGQNGLGNQSQVYNQLQGVASGQGPNPAQAMLNQSTGANVANQAALMAGQRGAGANVGLMARNAANTGANIQQQAAGQGATMQANQSLNALTAAGNMANTMAGNQISTTQNEQNTLQNANTANNNNNTTMANTTMQGQQKTIGGLGNALGAVTGLFASGGPVAPMTGQQGPMSSLGKALSQPMMAQGGKIPAMVSPGEIYLKPQAAQAVASGKADPVAVGEKIPGQAKVKGNSYANDTVKKDLDAGGVVVPRDKVQSKDPSRTSAQFVRAVLSKKRKNA